MSDAERNLRDLAPLMRDTILAWEASINAMTREETEDLYIKAAHLRKQVVGALKNILGGGGTVEEAGITPPSAAAEESAKGKLHFDIARSELGIPIKGQDGLPCDKSGITDGIIAGFAQPLPNLDHIINRTVPPPPIGWQEVKVFLDGLTVPGDAAGSETEITLMPSIDDDLDDVPLGSACSIDNPECDSCQ
jgi:hypothetical protein